MTLQATVSDDLRTIRGELRGPAALRWVSPLPLPGPPDDRIAERTYPGARDDGALTVEPLGDGAYRFTATLPRRYGGIGTTRHGLYALGGFHPVPMRDGEVVAVDWQVEVRLPGARLGLVGEQLGRGTVTWEGRAEAVALAIPRRARVEEVDGVTVLSAGRPRRVLRRQLAAILPTLGLDHPPIVVEAPLRRRLTRHAAGAVFVSDRSFQLTWPFHIYHRPGLVEGLLAADSRVGHPQLRALVGRVEADRWQATHQRLDAAQLTGALSWLPSIDALLSTRRMAFYSETFREPQPSDPVADGPVEVVAPSRPGASVASQLEARLGPTDTDRAVAGLRAGLTLPQALQLVGAPPGWAAELRAPVPPQDYTLALGDAPAVTRQAPAGAPPEVVEVRVDGELERHALGPGQTVDFPGAGRIAIDPQRKLSQASRDGDAFPVDRLRVVTTAFVHTLNLTRFRLEGSASMWLRGRNDTRNLLYGSLTTTRTTTLGLTLGYYRKFGPLRDGFNRRHRVSLLAGPQLVNGRFQSTADGPVAWTGSLAWTWSDRSAGTFPLRGSRLGLSSSGGFHPASDARWGSVVATASTTTSPHPRHAFAAAASLGIARTTRPDRLLRLGGDGRMASLPELLPCGVDPDQACVDVARERAIGRVEYRAAVIRGASVPLIGAWGRELQVAIGAEALLATVRSRPVHATGLTAGVSGVYDLFGAEPGLVGITAGWSTSRSPELRAPARRALPELFLRWGQAL